MACELERVVAIGDHGRWVDLHVSHAYICPSIELLDKLVLMSPLIEIGAGTGYWARLLRDLGADVIAADRDVPESTWSEVVVGTHELLANHPARSLLVVMPYRPRSEVIVKAYPGRRMVVCTQGAYPNLQMIGDDEQVLASALHSAGWDAVESISLPDPVDPSMAAHIFGR